MLVSLAALLVIMMVVLSVLISLTALVYMIYMPPVWLVKLCQHRWPEVLWHVDTQEKVIALTIDDGPSSQTGEILSILKANQSLATFFIIGAHVKGREAVLEQLVTDGHELGNHAMNDEPSRLLSNEDLASHIACVDEQINSTYQQCDVKRPPRYFRPGHGFFSTRMLKLLVELRHSLVLGDVFPFDPQIRLPWLNSWHILTMVRPGSVIICHDGDGRHWTMPMLRKVLPELKREGYRVVTITELLLMDQTSKIE